MVSPGLPEMLLVAGQCSRGRKHLLSSKPLPQHRKRAQRSLLLRPLSVPQRRDCIEKTGELSGPCGDSLRVERTVSSTELPSTELHPGALQCVPEFITEPISAQIQGNRQEGHCYMHLASLPTASLPQEASALDALSTCCAPTGCPNHPVHTVYTEPAIYSSFPKTGRYSYFV